MKKTLLFLLFSVAIAAGNAQTPLTTAVDFTVTTIEGTSFNLFDKLAENKYVCIDFFYYGCVPCQETAPKVNGSFENFGCNSGNVFFIGMNYNDNAATTAAFGTDFGAYYPAASGIDGGGNAVCSAYGITAYPTVILIAPDHTIVEQDIWPIADATYLNGVIAGLGGVAASCSSGINDNASSSHTTIEFLYPNPATDQCNISISVEKTAMITLEIYNVTGQMVYSNAADYSTGIHLLSIPLSNFNNGVYIVKMQKDQVVVDQERLVITK